MEEVWKDIKDYEGLYKISNLGNVFSIKSNRILKKPSNPKNYHRVALRKDGNTKVCSVHRLVAIAFIKNDNPNKNNLVNHIDENKLNNRVDNLEWCDDYYNMMHSRESTYKKLMVSVRKRYGK